MNNWPIDSSARVLHVKNSAQTSTDFETSTKWINFNGNSEEHISCNSKWIVAYKTYLCLERGQQTKKHNEDWIKLEKIFKVKIFKLFLFHIYIYIYMEYTHTHTYIYIYNIYIYIYIYIVHPPKRINFSGKGEKMYRYFTITFIYTDFPWSVYTF